jgi:hypothetical protein
VKTNLTPPQIVIDVEKETYFWEDPVWDMSAYLCEPRPWADSVVAITHNGKAFDLHFIINRAIFLKWKPKLIMTGEKCASKWSISLSPIA